MVSVAGVTARWGGVETGLVKEQSREEGRKFGEKLGGVEERRQMSRPGSCGCFSCVYELMGSASLLATCPAPSGAFLTMKRD